MKFKYKFKEPLKLHTSTAIFEIKELDIDLDDLTILDLTNAEKRYNKIIDGSTVPIIQREYTNCYHTAILEIIIKKQFPNLLITSKDIENIKGEDARNLLFSIKSLYLNIFLSQSIEAMDEINGDLI